MGDVISLEQYRKRQARRNRPAAKAKPAGAKKSGAKMSRPKDGTSDARKLSLDVPAGEPPKKES